VGVPLLASSIHPRCSDKTAASNRGYVTGALRAGPPALVSSKCIALLSTGGGTPTARDDRSTYVEQVLASTVYDVCHETPLQHAPLLSRSVAANVYLKREDTLPVFSFKVSHSTRASAVLLLSIECDRVYTTHAGRSTRTAPCNACPVPTSPSPCRLTVVSDQCGTIARTKCALRGSRLGFFFGFVWFLLLHGGTQKLSNCTQPATGGEFDTRALSSHIS
jgi:hypothetical protein